MMKTSLKIVWGAVVIASCLTNMRAEATSIQAYTSVGANTGGAGGNLNIGREFTVSGTGINVTDLGVYDDGGHVLLHSHDVTLFSISNFTVPASVTPLANVTIAAGLSSPSDFVFASLGAPLHLVPGIYGIAAYGMNNPSAGGDPYGDGGGLPDGIATPNVADDFFAGSRFDPYQFTGAGTPAFPQGGDQNNHSSAAFLYNVPEPSSIVLLALGAIGLLAAARRRSKS